MHRLSSRQGLRLLLIVLMVPVVGCAGKDDVSAVDNEKQAFEDLRNEIRQVIDDPAREAEAISLVDSLVTDLASLRTSVAERMQQVRRLNANYDATRDEFEALLNAASQQIQENRRRSGASHLAFLATVTPDEREEIEKVHSRAMNAAIKSLKAI